MNPVDREQSLVDNLRDVAFLLAECIEAEETICGICNETDAAYPATARMMKNRLRNVRRIIGRFEGNDPRPAFGAATLIAIEHDRPPRGSPLRTLASLADGHRHE